MMGMSMQEALDLWNVSATRCGWPLVRRLTADRERKVRMLIRHGLDDWREALAKAEASDFLCGRTERSEKHPNWRLTFDTFVQERIFTRILEGNYDNREYTPLARKSDEQLLWEAKLRGYKPGGFWLPMWGPRPEDKACAAPPSILAEWRNKQVH